MGIVDHTLPAPKGLLQVQVILDVGVGIRPVRWYRPTRHICIEPFEPYCRILRTAGYEVVQATASDALRELRGDAVYLLDVIEHMEKPVGLEVLELAKQAARYQVVVYTPNGFRAQSRDVWGLGGDEWQTHRSGWTPEEFEGWDVECFLEEGFFALWNHHSTPS